MNIIETSEDSFSLLQSLRKHLGVKGVVVTDLNGLIIFTSLSKPETTLAATAGLQVTTSVAKSLNPVDEVGLVHRFVSHRSRRMGVRACVCVQSMPTCRLNQISFA